MQSDVEAVRLFFTDHGTGEPVLLVHGWGGDGRSWDPVEFAGRRVVTVDLRGHGRSPVPSCGYRPRDYAVDLAALVDALDLPPVVAVGHSMGGQVAVLLAMERPDLVRAVVAIDPAYGADEAEAATFQERLTALRRDGAAAAVAQLGDLTDDVRDQLVRTPGHVLADSYAGLYTDPGAIGARPAAAEALAQLTRPLLCIRPTPSMAAWDLSCAVRPGSRVVLWPDAGHFLHRERPEAFAGLVNSWLASLSRS
ncbi:alpha/beta fold hydrolase [Kribbella sp. NPDC051586]|uniref:alpha/beta fold hydrolase n=1 Tax=Kribbella sp. NPDC051586 TaxID=3364118 RepID=UPI0037A781B4